MSAWTNVTIPDQFDRKDEMIEEIALLRFKLERANQKLESLYRQFENIPRAVIEHGYVDLDWDGRRIQLVERETVENLPTPTASVPDKEGEG